MSYPSDATPEAIKEFEGEVRFQRLSRIYTSAALTGILANPALTPRKPIGDTQQEQLAKLAHDIGLWAADKDEQMRPTWYEEQE